MLGFRTLGVDLERLRGGFGIDLLAKNEDVVDRLCASGHIEVDGSRLRPTLAGLAIADTLARSFTVSQDSHHQGTKTPRPPIFEPQRTQRAQRGGRRTPK